MRIMHEQLMRLHAFFHLVKSKFIFIILTLTIIYFCPNLSNMFLNIIHNVERIKEKDNASKAQKNGMNIVFLSCRILLFTKGSFAWQIHRKSSKTKNFMPNHF